MLSDSQQRESTRIARQVLVRCSGCQNLHLIADRLGYFEGQQGACEQWNTKRDLIVPRMAPASVALSYV